MRAVLTLATFVAACGSRSQLLVEDPGTGVDASAHDAAKVDAPPPPRPRCPAAEGPSPETCTLDGYLCEIPGSLTPFCNPTWKCKDGRWTLLPVGRTYTVPHIPQMDGNCEWPCRTGSCPSRQPGRRDRCDESAHDTCCQYADAACSCIGTEWLCTPAAPGCPLPRPAFGSRCEGPGRTCEYYQCGLYGFFAEMVCEDGHWRGLAREEC